MSSYRLLRYLSRLLIYFLVILAVVLSLAPLAYLLITSFKEPNLTFNLPPVWIFTPTLQNYREVLAGGQFEKYFVNSLVVALSTTTIALFLGGLAAYGFSRFRFRGAFWLRMSALIPQMLPPITIIVPLYVLFNGLKLLDTRWALIISYLTFTIPLALWMMIGFFDDVPLELEEAAMIDGCTRLGALVRVSLPLVAPGLAATAILAFLYCWNEFLYAVILTGREARTLPVTITSFMTNKAILWGRIAASGSMVLVPVLAFALLAQRYLVRGLSRGAIK
ncbi:MAG: Maltose/maltodextrin ABC transporter, permease protein MalG [Anaerolineae bacterium]|jgi:multiple sugar transport system permease protein|nr:MAG: Maltose/maltodextrin ABC transporter, permease protein MalG [Anaerolineae bacterium]